MKARHLVPLVLVLGLALAGCRGPRTGGPRRARPGRTTIVKMNAPPPPPGAAVVTRPARPGPRHVWVAGHHVHRGGHYVWVQGRWAVPPRAGSVWVAGRHDPHRGVWIAGAWR